MSEERIFVRCEPVETVILGLDTAKGTSGAVILIPDYGNPVFDDEEHAFNGGYVLHEYGKVETQRERRRFVESFLDIADDLGLPQVVMAETWDPPRTRRVRLPGGQLQVLMDPKWTYPTVLGIGEGWGRWSAEIEAVNEVMEEEGLPPLPVVRYTPNLWRDALWGDRRAKDTEGLKATAQRYFEDIFGYAVSDDIAEAGCIALAGTICQEVREVSDKWLDAFEQAELKKSKEAREKRNKSRSKKRNEKRRKNQKEKRR